MSLGKHEVDCPMPSAASGWAAFAPEQGKSTPIGKVIKFIGRCAMSTTEREVSLAAERKEGDGAQTRDSHKRQHRPGQASFAKSGTKSAGKSPPPLRGVGDAADKTLVEHDKEPEEHAIEVAIREVRML